jgi:molybdate transport system substrate-binding protein
MSRTLNLLSAGAAQGLVTALTQRLGQELAVTVSGRFGAVGAMREAFEAGESCDVFISTHAMVLDMASGGALQIETLAPLGHVETGVAVRCGPSGSKESDKFPHPDVSSAQALARALQACDALYFPDPQRATAGIHFAKVLRLLGLEDSLRSRFHTFPNGATAMREMAASDSARPLGCTQKTEILFTPGVEWVGPLPKGFELATVYTAAVSSQARDRSLAHEFVALLAGSQAASVRKATGFV